MRFLLAINKKTFLLFGLRVNRNINRVVIPKENQHNDNIHDGKAIKCGNNNKDNIDKHKARRKWYSLLTLRAHRKGVTDNDTPNNVLFFFLKNLRKNTAAVLQIKYK